jgi:hypothetical protein
MRKILNTAVNHTRFEAIFLAGLRTDLATQADLDIIAKPGMPVAPVLISPLDRGRARCRQPRSGSMRSGRASGAIRKFA